MSVHMRWDFRVLRDSRDLAHLCMELSAPVADEVSNFVMGVSLKPLRLT